MEREEWNERWSGHGEHDANAHHGHEEPDGLLVEVSRALKPGRAVDLACGLGSNVVWLAEQGWNAFGVDFADVAIETAASRAKARGVDASFAAEDALSYRSDEPFDLVSAFYLHLPDDDRRRMLASAAKLVKEGGHLLFVGHDASDSGWFREHLRGHGHEHANEEDEARVQMLVSRLTSPEVVAAELEELGLTIVRAEVVQHAAHGDGEKTGTTLVLATRT